MLSKLPLQCHSGAASCPSHLITMCALITIYLLEQVIPVFKFLNCHCSDIPCILETTPAFPWNQTILVLSHPCRSGGTGAHVWATCYVVLIQQDKFPVGNLDVITGLF